MPNDLSYDQPLTKSLVHKWSIDQVLLTDVRTISATETLLGAQIPRSHGLYCEKLIGTGNPDFAAFIEICRQSCFVVAHTQFGVPLVGNRYQFLFQELEANLNLPPASRSEVVEVRRPINVEVRSAVERQWRRGSFTSGLAWRFALGSSDGKLDFGDVRIRQTWIEREKWRSMREVMRRDRGLPAEARQPRPAASRLPPEAFGRKNPDNIVLGDAWTTPDGYGAVARVDIRHPTLFDHSIDHIYAMVQIEAVRQLALFAGEAELGRPAHDLEVVRCRANFESIGEFDAETVLKARIEARSASSVAMDVHLSQNERRVSTFRIEARGAFDAKPD